TKYNIGISGDYALVNYGDYTFYYGYEHSICGECGKNNKGEYCDEHEDADSIWCFAANFNGEEIIIPYDKLGVDKFDMVGCLLTGIMWVFAKYDLKKKTL
ncbi:MAG: hypothetical protein GY928_32000, partial [Colwellia sp.]|nr:hypothetical protein [Colwellia sp.]